MPIERTLCMVEPDATGKRKQRVSLPRRLRSGSMTDNAVHGFDSVGNGGFGCWHFFAESDRLR